jgi:hypothetical protein
MAYDGVQFGNRVDSTTERKLHGKVVDNILGAPTLVSRYLGMGKPFMGKTFDVTVDITSDNQFEWIAGLETLNSAAANTTITLSYARTFGTQPKVSIMTESFANAGETGTIPLDAFKYEKAAAEVLNAMGSVVYGSGGSNSMNGLGLYVDDSGTVGGQARSTYSQLNATDTASGGTLTLAKMATLHDTVTGSGAGIAAEEPNVGAAGLTVWSLYEQLLSPTVRNNYNDFGAPVVNVRGSQMQPKSSLKGNAGFTSASYRGMPIMKDYFATAQYLFMLNERYLDFMGHTVVPDEYKDKLEKVNLGTQKAYEGTGAQALDLPSEYNGWFYQKSLQLPNQAGTIARFWVIGNLVAKGFRRFGRLTGVTGV